MPTTAACIQQGLRVCTFYDFNIHIRVVKICSKLSHTWAVQTACSQETRPSTAADDIFVDAPIVVGGSDWWCSPTDTNDDYDKGRSERHVIPAPSCYISHVYCSLLPRLLALSWSARPLSPPNIIIYTSPPSSCHRTESSAMSFHWSGPGILGRVLWPTLRDSRTDSFRFFGPCISVIIP